MHYGVARRSGRYPYGSGEDPDQAGRSFLRQYEELKARGLGQVELASKLGMNTRQLRENILWARAEEKKYNIPKAKELKEQGMTDTKIGEVLGVSEGTVRNYLKEKTSVETNRAKQLENIIDSVKSGVDNTGYLDVGIGVERQLGVSRTKFNAVVNKLVADGEYYLHPVHEQRLSDPTGSKWTTIKVLTKDPDPKNTSRNKHLIRSLDTTSDDAALNIKKLEIPKMISLDRVKVRYKEEGGADKDGLIELRPGVKDLDLGTSKYAQVRIGAGENLYMKGMAAYSHDKFPTGVDIIFNTNKSVGTPVEKVLKPIKMGFDKSDDPRFIFGSSIRRQKGALNIVQEEGEWHTWSSKLSSQFLSKQPLTLIKERLDATHSSLKSELDSIMSMTNPVVKAHFLNSESAGFIGSLDKKASHLKAQGFPNTKSHVIMPFPDMNPKEVYAPQYPDGSRVVLVRHPHGGIFEIPDLIVNNKNAKAKQMLGNALDAIGLHPSNAEKLSGADFDGDSVLVIPNNQGKIKSSRSLKELNGWGEEMHVRYKRDHETISSRAKQTQMGLVSNLITDMTIKGASESELARAIRHSMVVIDSEKHKLDYKQSQIDNGIIALMKKYQTHTDPDTGKKSRAASTLISRSKRRIDLSQHEEVRKLVADKVDRDGKVVKPGMSIAEVAKKFKITEARVKEYLQGAEFTPDKYASEYAQDKLYLGFIKNVQSLKNEALKLEKTIEAPFSSKDAAKVYSNEIQSLNLKLNTALLNAPRARQAQILTNKLFWTDFNKDMDKDDIKKLKSISRAKADVLTQSSKAMIKVTDMEWEAIQAGAVSTSKLKEILKHADLDIIRKHATPREKVLDNTKIASAKTLLNNGYTYAQVAEKLGVSASTLIEELK
jgi:predicted transcriptional regulator